MKRVANCTQFVAAPLVAFSVACLAGAPAYAGDAASIVTAQAQQQQVTVIPGKTDKDAWLKFTFKPEEQKILREYYSQYPPEGTPKKQKHIPPGLQKKLARGGELPPGWQKKVARGEVMPSEVYKYSTRVPQDVWAKLPPQPPGTVIVNVEGKVVRLMEATRTIIDVLELTAR